MSKQSSYSREGYLLENYRYFHLRDTAGQERDFHFHEFDKVVLLLSGRVDYFVEGITYALKPRDILLVKHHTIHKALIDKSVPYDRIIIYLDRKYFDRVMPEGQLCSCFDRCDTRRDYLLRPRDEDWQSIAAAFSAFEQMIPEEAYGSQTMRDTLMMQLLIYINRICVSAAADTPAERQTDGKIARVLSYINENLTGELSLEIIAREAKMSKSYFSTIFKKMNGIPVWDYITRKRVELAMTLLRDRDKPVIEVAESCGFSSISNFNRCFRQVTGISPSAYRKEVSADEVF